MSNIINYEELEEPLKDIEKRMEEYDIEEKQMIVKFLHKRIQDRINEQKVKDSLANNSLYTAAMKMLGKKKED